MSPRPTIRSLMIAERIHTARRDLGLSQDALAALVIQAAADDGEDISLDRSAVSRWEAGTFEPALRYRKYIARVLDRDRRELFPAVSINDAA